MTNEKSCRTTSDFIFLDSINTIVERASFIQFRTEYKLCVQILSDLMGFELINISRVMTRILKYKTFGIMARGCES